MNRTKFPYVSIILSLFSFLVILALGMHYGLRLNESWAGFAFWWGPALTCAVLVAKTIRANGEEFEVRFIYGVLSFVIWPILMIALLGWHHRRQPVQS